MSFRHIANPIVRGATVLIAAIAVSGLASSVSAAEFSAKDIAFFETKIRPVLVEHCYSCHSSEAEDLQAGLLLDSREGVLRGGDSGSAVVPGKPVESLLIEALKYESYEMPPSGKLPNAVIADFEKWVAMGLPDPRSGPAPSAPRPAIGVAEGRKFWCFQPIQSPQPPAVKDQGWPACDIDRFLLAKLEEHKLKPAAAADRATWLRRVTFDLIGLPPSIEELDAFAADDSPDAHARVVDRLLASPHFGERWGRHWLDIARFAESSGGGRSLVFKDAWRYRDYVIDSVNRDKPLDEFIIEQIAGDLLPHSTDAERREHLIATAYLVLGPHNYEEQDKRALEMDVVDEQLDTIGRGLLGMTVACARCHDHKFDPIPTGDYYALAGIFRSTHVLTHANVSAWTTRSLPMTAAESAEVAAFKKRLNRQLAKVQKRLIAAEKKADKQTAAALKKEFAELKKSPSPAPTTMGVEDGPQIEDCKICIRGSVRHRGPVVSRGVLQVAAYTEPPYMPADASGRLELARWIASPDNPLTARVYVNRVWHYLFGAGLVRTLDNFGTTGETPSHPELLDYLASRFIEDGWSTKRLIRELVLSHAYRRNAQMNDRAALVDPENRLLWRMNRRRLDAESLRDAMLVVSGRLDRTIGGLNILDPDVLYKSSATHPSEYGYKFADKRRSVYTPAFRNWMHELFEVFDFADQNRSVAQRSVTTAAPQALFMLNSAFVMEQSRAGAERALADAKLSDQQRVERAFRETLGRLPSSGELAVALETTKEVSEGGETSAESRRAAWEQLFQALFASVDFRRLD